LIVYRFALSAVAGTTFVWMKATTAFLVVLLGGAVTGFVIGFIMAHTIRLIQKSSLAILSLFLLSPFVAYLIAEEFHFSGVIAVVILGIVMSFFSRKKLPETIKDQSKTIWDVIAFLLNGFIFILLGLEVPVVINTIKSNMLLPYTGFALVLTIIAILVRATRVFLLRKSLELVHKKTTKHNTRRKIPKALLLSVQESLVISWSGMRGIVSLAIAFALPQTLENGQPFPYRTEIIFITTLVILFTIVGQGIVLPFIAKRPNREID
jgi:CPA1 family monovalent cation:H+ antiporter